MSGGQYPQPGGYQQQPYGHYQPGYGHAAKAHRGAMLLVFSILPWVVPCVGVIFAIIAFFMAKADLREMQQGIMDRGGEGLTKAAFWLSVVSMIVFVLLLIGGFIFGFASVLFAPEVHHYE